MNARLLLAVSALQPREARAVVQLICAAKSSTFEKSRDSMQKKLKNSLSRVFGFAKSETLRKLHRYMHANRPLKGQDAPPHHDAVRIAFDPGGFQQDLSTSIASEVPDILNDAADETLLSLGYTSPWQLPSQAVLDYLKVRDNFLSGISDDIYQEIQDTISQGLLAGEGVADLADRISAEFDQIESDRAETIAENETNAAYNYASDAAAKAAGVQFKKWSHSSVPKVPRPDHLAIDGLVVPIDQPFPVGDPPLMFPHDSNGSPEDVINCRCISVPATEDDYNSQ